MSLTPYDWNQSIQARMEYIEERLREGSPVVGLSLPQGVLLVSVHRAPRKVFEIYDRLIFAGIGNQSDIETMRLAALDFAHQEGYLRSPDDVTLHRLVASVLSPALKKAYGDPFTAPFVFRGLFAELGGEPDQDGFLSLGFDGEYRREHQFAAVAGAAAAENRMIELLHAESPRIETLDQALRLAMEAWAVGWQHRRPASSDEQEASGHGTPQEALREELKSATLEAAILDRHTRRESRFRLLNARELEEAVARYR
jgi:proteasome alpha subunit